MLSLETGADDYMAKPFSVRELLARIRLRLRDGSFREAAAAPKVFTVDGVTIDFLKQSALVAGQTVRLTHTELEILRYLITREGQVISRERLLAEIWGDSTHVTTR